MAGSSDQMKEQLAIYEDTADPLDTLPPFGGAEAKPQNSEKPDLTPEDSIYISKLIKSSIGIYPADAPWLEPQTGWIEALRQRKEPITRANHLIHEYFTETKGKSSEISITTGILSEITPELTQIAISQFEQGFTGPKSWQGIEAEASYVLDGKIDKILNNMDNAGFFVENSSVKKGLELIQNVLIKFENPGEIFEKHSEYMKECIQANSNGKPILYIPFESDFTNPVKSEQERTQICEAMVSVVMPMKVTERKELDKLIESTWDQLKERKHAHKTNSKLNVIVGTNIMGAGFEVLDSTVGESFIIKHNGGHEHGFYLAINNLAKKYDFWKASTELINLKTSKDPETYYKNLILLYVLHEEGHRLFPVHGIQGEVPADIPAVMYAIKISLQNNQQFEVHEVLKAIVTEYVSEIVNSVSDTDWIEGHNSNSGNDLFDGYLLSSVIIINALADSGIARVNREGKIDINLTSENLAKLFDDLETVDAKFHEKDEKTLDKIKLAVANPEAREIIELYRNKIKEKQFTQNTSLLQEMVKLPS
jgi:hypothetical protein